MRYSNAPPSGSSIWTILYKLCIYPTVSKSTLCLYNELKSFKFCSPRFVTFSIIFFYSFLSHKYFQWYVKPTADEGRAEGWICSASDPPARPVLLTGTCELWDGDRWTVQTHVTKRIAAYAFESILYLQLFCAEESEALRKKLNATLKRTIGILSTSINPDGVEEGTKQLTNRFERATTSKPSSALKNVYAWVTLIQNRIKLDYYVSYFKITIESINSLKYTERTSCWLLKSACRVLD